METKLKPFDLEAAKAGAPVVTRDGRRVRIVCTDMRHSTYCIVALVDIGTEDDVRTYRNDGLFCADQSDEDLFMAPIKRQGWVNIYRTGDAHTTTGGTVHESEKIARDSESGCGRYIATVPVEWEE